MTKVRTTFNPDVILDVEDSEFLDLSRQGLINSYDHGNKPLPEGFEPWKGGEVTTGLDVQPAEDETKKTTTKKGDS